jgi:F0F1-type ATP synthase membrane subunit b/b'
LDVLNNVATASVVLGFCGGVFSYFILRPLNNAIVELRVAVRELRSDLRTAEERRQQLEIKVAEIDQRAKAAHNRLDEMIKRGERQ